MQDFQEDEKKNHDRIMLVEDDTTITRVLKRQLERWGYEVLTRWILTCGGSICRVETGSGADGSDASVFQWLLLVQRDTKVSDVPIIVISSAGDDMNLVMAINMGAGDFLAKCRRHGSGCSQNTGSASSFLCICIGKSTLLCRKRDIGSDRSRSALQGERAEAVRK